MKLNNEKIKILLKTYVIEITEYIYKRTTKYIQTVRIVYIIHTDTQTHTRALYA